jgi:glycine betaine/choline ABC-type transport system substrate-binding protein
MSEFSSEGFTSFPNTYEDNKHVANISDLEQPVLEWKLGEYTAFLQRDDLMPRAREVGGRVLNHLIFEQTWRFTNE